MRLKNRAGCVRVPCIARPFTKEPTTMNSHLYHAQYFNGPCDGMVVVATRQSGEDPRSMPVATANGQTDTGGRSMTEICQAVYKLIRTCHMIDHGMPTIRYEYEFVGLDVAAPITRSVVSGWLAIVKKRLKCLFQPSLWLPLPEGRPKRPGQAGCQSCPGRGLGLNSNRTTSMDPTRSRGSVSSFNDFWPESFAKH